jgi:hypothetical protein
MDLKLTEKTALVMGSTAARCSTLTKYSSRYKNPRLDWGPTDCRCHRCGHRGS